MTQLLFAGNDETLRLLDAVLKDDGGSFGLRPVPTLADLGDALAGGDCPVVISELECGGFTVLDVVSLVREASPDTTVIPLADTGGEPLALRCMEQGVDQVVLRTRDFLRRLPLLVQHLVRRSRQERERRLFEGRLRDIEERYQDIFDNTSDLIQCLGPDGRFLYTNRAWRETLGYSQEEVKSLTLGDVLHPESVYCCMERFERLKKGETLSRIDFKFLTKNGETVHLMGECGSLIKNGEAVSTRGIFKDITGERRTEEALKASEARYQLLYENAPDIYSTVNTRGEIVSINRIGAAMLGYEVDELIGQPAAMLIHPDDREPVRAYLATQFENPAPGSQIEYRKLHKDGSVLWVQQRVTRLPVTDDSDGQLLIVCRDVTENRKLSEQLAYQATHDELTDLVNRREFERRLVRVLTSPSQGTQHALCYLDLDQFKVINDTCGHIAGDELLRQISRLLTKQIRSRDTLARLGGDEFAVLMEHCPLEQAEQRADRLRKTIEDFRFHWRSRRFSIGVSIGVVPIDGDSKSMQQLLSLADSACYAAKERGRNRVYVCRPDDSAMVTHVGEMRWASHITQALEKGMFRLYAQPIVSCQGGANGDRYEILLRLQERNGRIIAPGAFLPAAERYNLSTRLDRWVLESVLSWLADHPRSLTQLHLCSINLSALSLCDETFLSDTMALIDGSGVPHDKLCFEITETAAISNLSRAIEFIETFKQHGCRFALDDFGSGLSSFAYLKNLPVDILKIDGAFVRDIAHNDIDRAMVKSISEVAALMGKTTTAEYVESSEALDVLRQLGVDYAQGYHLGRPAPIDDVADNPEQDARIVRLPRT